MKRKLVAIALLVLFVMSTFTAFAAVNTKTETPQKSIFQETSDNITAFFKPRPGGKKPLTNIFQESYSEIDKSSPDAKQLSLRDNPEELKKRRGNQ